MRRFAPIALFALCWPGLADASDRDAIRTTIRENRPRLHACYEVALARQPDFRPRVVVSFEVAPDGRVRSARVTQTDAEAPAFESCLLDEIRGWALKRAPGAGRILVSHPFVFHPPSGAALPQPSPSTELDARLDPERTRAVLEAGREQLAACYGEGAQRVPGLSGQGSVLMTVAADGTVSAARVDEAALPDAAARACIEKAVLGWRFPPPAGGAPVEVRYPFVLAPR